MNDPIFVIGHKNPDNDSICSAVAYAQFKNDLARHEGRVDEAVYEPKCLGALPVESAWVLETAGFAAPELISSVEPGQQVALVDHNEVQQAVDGIEEADIVEVVDHHRIGNFSTAKPIQFITFPWGCTATIITALYRSYGLEIKPELARVLLSAILTDTVIMKSPTTTDVDRSNIAYLGEIAHLDPQAFGLEIFDKRGGEDTMEIHTLVCADSKEFPVEGKTVLIAQRETVSPAKVMAREEEMRTHMRSLIEEHGYDFVLLLVTDILNEGSFFLVEGNPEVVERVFDITCVPGGVWMPGVLSRKKQVAAPLLGA